MGCCHSQPLSKVKNVELVSDKKKKVSRQKCKECKENEAQECNSENCQVCTAPNNICQLEKEKSRPYFSFNAFFYENPNPQIFDWLFLQELCNGTTSQIYLVRNVENQFVCVAKVYNNSILYRQPLGNELSPIDLFNKEIDVMCQLTHSHIMSYHELVDDQMTNSKILILPYATLGNLKTAISNNMISYDNLLVCFYQICRALSYMHSNDIVHRDICPENILVFTENYFVLNHFKSACKYSNPDFTKIYGQFRYLSPEELNEKTYDLKKADIWKYGITFYCSFFRKKPFDLDIIQIDDKANKYEKLYAHLMSKQLEIPNIEALPSALNDLLERILSKDPNMRPSFEEIMENEIFNEARKIKFAESTDLISASPSMNITPIGTN